MSPTPYKPSDFYKPQLRWRGLVSALLFIIAALIVLAVVLFFALGRYVVVTPDRIYLALPGSSAELDAAENEVTRTPSVTAELVVEQPDFSSIEAVAGEELSAVKALYLKAEDINADKLSSIAGAAADSGAGAVMLQLKAGDGQLIWNSAVTMAVSYGASGALDLTSYISAWKDTGLYLIAQLSCCTDELMAVRYPALALKGTDGAAYHDDTGYWLDPYNRTVREYIVDLARELTEMGFDEIVFAQLSHPDAEGLTYTQAMTAAPDPKAAIDSFSLRLYRAFEGSDAHISVRCSANSVRNDLSARTGEDIDFYLKVFDRLYCDTDAAGAISDQSSVEARITGENKAARFVPVVSGTVETDSWVIPG